MELHAVFARGGEIGVHSALHATSSLLTEYSEPFTTPAPGFDRVYLRTAREALRYYLEVLIARFPGRSRVVLPAFICESVPDAIVALGLQPDYVDLAPDSLFPRSSDLIERAGTDALAIISAPYFGIYSREAISLEKRSRAIPFIVDLAQGFGCPFEDLDADGLIFSFGVGKGTDYYGGSVLFREGTLPTTEPLLSSETSRTAFFRGVKSLLIRNALRRPSVQRVLDSIIERRMSVGKKVAPPARYEQLSQRSLRNIAKYGSCFFDTIRQSRARAHELFEMPVLQPLLSWAAEIDRGKSTFLRFPLLFTNSAAASSFIGRARARGISATAAAERVHGSQLPNFGSFNERIVKLPYLGSLSEREFAYMKTNIARALSDE